MPARKSTTEHKTTGGDPRNHVTLRLKDAAGLHITTMHITIPEEHGSGERCTPPPHQHKSKHMDCLASKKHAVSHGSNSTPHQLLFFFVFFVLVLFLLCFCFFVFALFFCFVLFSFFSPSPINPNENLGEQQRARAIAGKPTQ